MYSSKIIVCCCCRALLYSEKSRFSLGFRYLKADLTDKSHELFIGRFKWHNEKQDKIISSIKICLRFSTCFERYFLLIDSMLSKSNMIALNKTINLSYQLYNMIVFQKMKRMPTKNKKKSSFIYHKETKQHHFPLYLYCYALNCR